MGGEAVPGPAPLAGTTPTAHGPPIEDHEVARLHLGDPVADLLDDAGRLLLVGDALRRGRYTGPPEVFPGASRLG